MVNHECQGLAGRLFGHAYQPVYETRLGSLHLKEAGGCPWHLVEKLIESLKERKYVHSVCRRCGSVIAKQEEA